jgi:DNA repair exonuclease SbcCD ATPase subunit
VRRFDKTVGGLDISSRKASGALKGFARDIAQARDGADVASAALDVFGRVLGGSIAGTAVAIGAKLAVDSFISIRNASKEAEKSVANAFAEMDKAGKALTFADAVGQAKTFENAAERINAKIKEIASNPLSNFIDDITLGSLAMQKLAHQSEEQARLIRLAGAEAELAHLSRIKGLDAEGKALAANERALEKELEGIDAIKEASTALAVTQKYAMQADEIRAKFADERGKVEAELAAQKQKQLEDTIKKEKELGEAQQKRFNELYDAEIKSQEQMQKRIDAELKAAQELADKKATLEENVKKAEGATPGGGGGGGGGGRGGGGGAGTVPGLSRPPGQRETSAERGAREQGDRAFQKARQQEEERYRENIAQQLKEKGQASDRNAVHNEIIKREVEKNAQEGANIDGLKQYNDAIAAAKAEQKAFNDSLKNSSEATRDYGSELGKGMSELAPEFDRAQRGVDNFSEGLTENSGNMIDDFLQTGRQSDDLGQDFDRTGGEVEKFGEAVKKASPPPGQDPSKGKGKKADDPLTKIHTLLEKNLEEMRTYALVK